jgi:hypothetical protein
MKQIIRPVFVLEDEEQRALRRGDLLTIRIGRMDIAFQFARRRRRKKGRVKK